MKRPTKRPVKRRGVVRGIRFDDADWNGMRLAAEEERRTVGDMVRLVIADWLRAGRPNLRTLGAMPSQPNPISRGMK